MNMDHSIYTFDQIISAIAEYKTMQEAQTKTGGDYLKALREAKGWTQLQVAGMIFKSKKAYEKYEQNKRQPSMQTFMMLSKVYNISLHQLTVSYLGELVY